MEPVGQKEADKYAKGNAQLSAELKRKAKEMAVELYNRGLSTPTIEAVLFSPYHVLGGKNLISGEKYSDGERVMMGIQIVSEVASLSKVSTNSKPRATSPADKSRPSTYSQLEAELLSQGFNPPTRSSGGYITFKNTKDGRKVDIKPTGEVILMKKVWTHDKSRKYSERTDYKWNRLPDQSHSTGYYIDRNK